MLSCTSDDQALICKIFKIEVMLIRTLENFDIKVIYIF